MYKLAIDDVVEVPVKFTIKSGRVIKPFTFTLTCTRLFDHDEITARLEEKENKFKEFMAGLVTGWSGQRLVLDEAGQPVEFNDEALNAMLSVPGVAKQCYDAYMREVLAKEKN